MASSFDNMLKTCISDILQSNSTSLSSRPAGFSWPSHFYVSVQILMYRCEECRIMGKGFFCKRRDYTRKIMKIFIPVSLA